MSRSEVDDLVNSFGEVLRATARLGWRFRSTIILTIEFSDADHLYEAVKMLMSKIEDPKHGRSLFSNPHPDIVAVDLFGATLHLKCNQRYATKDGPYTAAEAVKETVKRLKEGK